jgi:hypothetical protein
MRPPERKARLPRKPGRRSPPTVWVPRTLSPHATCTYSCTRPPSRSWRSGRTVAVKGGGVWPAGGCCWSDRCGLCLL